MAECRDILTQLESGDIESIRDAAYFAGEQCNAAAIPQLVTLLESDNLGVQEAAEMALRKIGGGEVIEQVVPLLRSDDAPVRNHGMDILREIGGQDVDILVELLHDDDPDIRIFVSDILGTANKLRAVEALCESLLKDPEVNVRYQAAVSLGELAYKEAASCLNKALDDDEWVQFAVIEALTKIRDESSVAALTKALDSSSDLVASMIVEALGELGNIKAVAMLLKRMDDSPTALRNVMVKAVVNILGGSSLKLLSETEREKFRQYLLVAIADEEADIQDAAITGLGAVGGEMATSEMLRIASDLTPERDEERLRRVVESLAQIGFNAALEEGVRQSEGQMRAMVTIEVLSRCPGSDEEALLRDVFWDKERDLQREIMNALLKIGTDESNEFVLDVLQKHNDGSVLKGALQLLGEKTRMEAAGETLFSFLEHPWNDVKEAALEACICLDGEQMATRFVELGASPEPLNRLMAVYAFGKMGHQEHMELLKSALEDEIPDIRKVAMESLCELNDYDKAVLPVIVPRLSDEDSNVRLAVVEVLGRVNGAESVPYLLQALDDSDDWVRIRAMESLAATQEQSAVAKLVPMLSSGNTLIILKVIESLGAIGGQAAFRALLEISASDDPEVQAAAEDAVERLKSAEEGES